MKAKRTEKVQIKLTLSEQEAEMLCALLGGVAGSGAKHPAVFDRVQSMFHALDAYLPDRELSFGDFFNGDVSVK